MRAITGLILLATCILITVAYQAIQQELNIRRLNAQISLNTDGVKRMEDTILTTKLQVQKKTSELAPLIKQKDELTKKKNELAKMSDGLVKNTSTCENQKKTLEKKKTDDAAVIEKLKTDQNAEEQKIQEEIKSFQKKILDRDVKICLYLENNNEEGRKLCEEKKQAQTKML